MKKKELLEKKQAHIIKVETRLTQIEDLLHSANEKIKAAEKQATSAIALVIKEYKKTNDFEWNTAKAGVDAYFVIFANCKVKVARAYL